MKKKLLGYYDYTVVLTYCGMLSAVSGIFLAMSDSFVAATVCLMVSGICDMFDGAVASTKDRNAMEKCFGIQIDSLSDLISFGILPAVLCFCIAGRTLPGAVCSALFALAALIRLAYFNVLEEERQRSSTGRRETYQGLPVTSIAMSLPLFTILWLNGIVGRIAFPILLAVTAICFISNFEIKKPHGKMLIVFVVVGVSELTILFLSMGALLR